jgi:FkbM family methyltransferase
MRALAVAGLSQLRGGARWLHRVAAFPPVAYPLLLCWQRHWLPIPHGDAEVCLRDHRLLRCRLSDQTQRTMFFGLFEPAETSLVTGLLGPGDTFIDVGAHIGWFTTVASARVGPAGRVIACEPYPANADLLKENLSLNDAHNVQVVESALGSRPGTLTLAGGDSGSVTALEWVPAARVEVPMTTLDEVAAGVPVITLLKVDVEGWEAHVLGGAARALPRTRNVLIEINRPALKKAGSSPEEIFDLLRSSGFSTFRPVAQTGLRRLLSSADVSNVLASRPS